VEAVFLCPPMLGTYVNVDAKSGESPIRPCLIIAWDNHTENYLIADRETGEQAWRSLTQISINGDSVLASFGMDDAHGKFDNSPNREDGDDNDESDRCPVCKQTMPY